MILQSEKSQITSKRLSAHVHEHSTSVPDVPAFIERFVQCDRVQNHSIMQKHGVFIALFESGDRLDESIYKGERDSLYKRYHEIFILLNIYFL